MDQNLKQELLGKIITGVEFDMYPRFGFTPEDGKSISRLIFSDGSVLNIEAVMAGENDSDPYVSAELAPKDEAHNPISGLASRLSLRS